MNKLLLTAMTALSLTSLTFVFAATAQAQTSTKRDIQRLARSIDEALLDSTSGESDLAEAREKMEQALKLIRQGGGNSGPGPDACIQFAYEKYYQSMSSAAAMDKASLACRQVDSVEVMKFLYEKYYQSQSSAAAMDSAAKGSVSSTSGKLEILKYAYEKYYQSQSATAAADNAVNGTRSVRRDSLACLKTAYDRYYQSKSAVEAMNSAFAACR